MNILNIIKVILSCVIGWIVSILGGWDSILATVIMFIVIDYVTGVINAIIKKQLSSSIMFVGIIKKIFILFIIAMAVQLEKMLNIAALREIAIIFYIGNEGISIFENVGPYVPLPKKMKDVFVKLQEKDGILNE